MARPLPYLELALALQEGDKANDFTRALWDNSALFDLTEQDEEGNYIDVDGNKVNFSGEYVSEFSPFLDDKGKPVVLKDKEESTEEQPEEPEKPKPRRRRKKQETN